MTAYGIGLIVGGFAVLIGMWSYLRTSGGGHRHARGWLTGRRPWRRVVRSPAVPVSRGRPVRRPRGAVAASTRRLASVVPPPRAAIEPAGTVPAPETRASPAFPRRRAAPAPVAVEPSAAAGLDAPAERPVALVPAAGEPTVQPPGDEVSWAPQLPVEESWVDGFWDDEVGATPPMAGDPRAAVADREPTGAAIADRDPAGAEVAAAEPAGGGEHGLSPVGGSPGLAGVPRPSVELGRRPGAETEVIPVFSELTQLMPAFVDPPVGPAEGSQPVRRPRPRPRPRTAGPAPGDRYGRHNGGEPPARSTVYVSRHAAEPA